MSNTRQKLLAGLLLLCGLAFLVFQFIKNLKSQKQKAGNLPKQNNNPFALFQLYPSNWLGLIGKNSNGFLQFDSVANGVRAGFINLYQRYLKQGLNTIDKIAPVYTGSLNWNAYAMGLSQISGLNIEAEINDSNVLKLARAIERMEEGEQWVSDSDFNAGYLLAKKYLGL